MTPYDSVRLPVLLFKFIFSYGEGQASAVAGSVGSSGAGVRVCYEPLCLNVNNETQYPWESKRLF